MDEKLKHVYTPAPLTQYSFRQRLTIRFAAMFFTFLIHVIGRTVRWEAVGEENLQAVEDSGRPPIYTVWHNRIFLGTYYLRGRRIVVITSQSFDGEYIARFLTSFGFGSVRGSSTRGGIGALVEMVRLAKRGIATAFTIDGPKGPRYVAKPGACLLARKTGSPILPVMAEADKYWTVGSWDKLQIPKPFTRARFYFGEPIEVASDAGDEELAEALAEVQKRLDELVEHGEQWRSSIRS